jgi:hypothetical protein
MRHTTKVILLFITSATTCYAVDPQQFFERERQQMVRPAPLPLIRQQSPPVNRERKEMQLRQESQNSGQNPSGFRPPQTVSIDQLKLRSDSLAEYQFEQIQILTLQNPDSVPQAEEPPQTEAAAEETQSEQPAEEIASAEEPGQDEDAASPEQISAEDDRPQYTIIEEQNRIIVTQVDAPETPVVKPR